MQVKKLYIPYSKDESPKVTTDISEYENFDGEGEGFSIAVNLSLLCKIPNNGHPNPHLTKFGVDFYGPCLIVKEDEDNEVDVDDDIYEKLGEIFRKDKEQREKYIQSFQQAGIEIIKF